MKKIRILLVDDHTILRVGLRAYLRYQEDMQVVGDASNGSEAVDLVEKLVPDVVLMDIAMPEMNGIQSTKIIHGRHPTTRVLVLTQHPDPQYILQVLQAGAAGYVLKDVLGTDLLSAIRAVARGESFLSPAAAQALAQEISHHGKDESIPYEALTPRERQVLKHVAAGQTNAQVAVRLSISENTVAWHRANLMSKLGVHSATELVRYAFHEGLADEIE